MNKSPTREFTDYLQEWAGDNVNWSMIMTQAKNIMKEYELSWKDMLYVLKYCRVYENIEWNDKYGLGQLFPKFIKPTQEFCEQITRMKKMDFDCEDEVYIVKKKKLKEREVDFS